MNNHVSCEKASKKIVVQRVNPDRPDTLFFCFFFCFLFTLPLFRVCLQKIKYVILQMCQSQMLNKTANSKLQQSTTKP